MCPSLSRTGLYLLDSHWSVLLADVLLLSANLAGSSPWALILIRHRSDIAEAVLQAYAARAGRVGDEGCAYHCLELPLPDDAQRCLQRTRRHQRLPGGLHVGIHARAAYGAAADHPQS